jgi:hypothetical protein
VIVDQAEPALLMSVRTAGEAAKSAHGRWAAMQHQIK